MKCPRCGKPTIEEVMPINGEDTIIRYCSDKCCDYMRFLD